MELAPPVALGAGAEEVRATNWRRAVAASLPWVLVGMSAAAALLGAWWITGTQAAVAFFYRSMAVAEVLLDKASPS